MDDAFKIYIEQLRDGHTEKLEETFDSGFLEVTEKDLSFQDPILLKGDAYLAEDMLILNLNVETQAILPCSICNTPVKIALRIGGFYHAEPIEQIKGGIFNFKEVLREMILLDAPHFAECEGRCPRRQEIAKYLKEPQKENTAHPQEDEGYHPFADFDWDANKKKK
jgi:uncharacterized metal-binding protein YceD (DUF177 family)